MIIKLLTECFKNFYKKIKKWIFNIIKKIINYFDKTNQKYLEKLKCTSKYTYKLFKLFEYIKNKFFIFHCILGNFSIFNIADKKRVPLKIFFKLNFYILKELFFARKNIFVDKPLNDLIICDTNIISFLMNKVNENQEDKKKIILKKLNEYQNWQFTITIYTFLELLLIPTKKIIYHTKNNFHEIFHLLKKHNIKIIPAILNKSNKLLNNIDSIANIIVNEALSIKQLYTVIKGKKLKLLNLKPLFKFFKIFNWKIFSNIEQKDNHSGKSDNVDLLIINFVQEQYKNNDINIKIFTDNYKDFKDCKIDLIVPLNNKERSNILNMKYINVN